MKTTGAEKFLSNIKAAVMVGQLLETGAVDSFVPQRRLTVQEIDRLLANPDQGDSWSPRLKTAFQFATQTDSMGIVFDGLSVRLKSHRWRTAVLRRTGWYLLLLIVTMVLGLAFFFYYSNPLFENLRSDLQLMSTAQYVPQTDPVAWLIPAMVGAIVVAVIALIWILIGGPQRTVWLLGGRAIARWRETSVALNAIEQSHQSGMTMEESINLSCDLVAASSATRGRIEKALSGSNESSGITAWADSMATAAIDRMTKIELWLPLATTTLMGGALATIYCLLIYKPIISMLCELASAVEG